MNKVHEGLNQYLAELGIFYRKLQNFHWYIKGHNFFQIHEKLEQYYDAINEEIDVIAEHILMVGGEPLGTLKDYLAIGKIKEAENKKVTSDVVLPAILEDFKYLKSLVAKVKADADEADCTATSALLDDSIAEYNKTIWMISQTLEK